MLIALLLGIPLEFPLLLPTPLNGLLPLPDKFGLPLQKLLEFPLGQLPRILRLRRHLPKQPRYLRIDSLRVHPLYWFMGDGSVGTHFDFEALGLGFATQPSVSYELG